MRRPTRAYAVALTLLLSSVGATAQLTPLVQAPAPPLPVAPLPTVSNVTRTAKPIVATATKPGGVAQTVTKTIGSAAQSVPIVGPAGQPLRPMTRASALLQTPLARAGTDKPAIAAPPISISPNRAAKGAPHVDFALNRVSTLPIPPRQASATRLAGARNARLRALIQHNAQDLDADDLGQPVIRGQLVLLDADAASLKRLKAVGFRILADEKDSSLRLRMTTLRAPPGLSTRAALRRLRGIAPRITADFNHVFEPAGGALSPVRSAPARGGSKSGLLIGMIDGGVAGHPSLSGRIVEQKAFSGALAPTAHGTAVASLLAGQHSRFRGAASGARLLVADVYGGRASAGSATAITRAMSWLSSRQPRVINVSLVGPRNELMRRAVAGLRARGIELVAAVGNDGPAAPPQYPASYPGVTAVTGVDARGVVLFEAGNATGLDFAAPGADMAAARPGYGYVRVRGTSFAAPLAAGRLAQLRSPRQLAAEARPGKGRVGLGIVCANCRTAPQLVGAK